MKENYWRHAEEEAEEEKKLEKSSMKEAASVETL